MNERELTGKVHSSVYHQCQKHGFATPVDVLMDVGVLTKEKYEDWRFGRVPYLEQVCNTNLHKLSFIMGQVIDHSFLVTISDLFGVTSYLNSEWWFFMETIV